jgi:hypothetical protein
MKKTYFNTLRKLFSKPGPLGWVGTGSFQIYARICMKINSYHSYDGLVHTLRWMAALALKKTGKK